MHVIFSKHPLFIERLSLERQESSFKRFDANIKQIGKKKMYIVKSVPDFLINQRSRQYQKPSVRHYFEVNVGNMAKSCD